MPEMRRGEVGNHHDRPGTDGKIEIVVEIRSDILYCQSTYIVISVLMLNLDFSVEETALSPSSPLFMQLQDAV